MLGSKRSNRWGHESTWTASYCMLFSPQEVRQTLVKQPGEWKRKYVFAGEQYSSHRIPQTQNSLRHSLH